MLVESDLTEKGGVARNKLAFATSIKFSVRAKINFTENFRSIFKPGFEL